ncbi:ATP-dependent DNA ligase [Comamonas koreensis]|uniref:DNA ligase (ATP) n=1 Tax=Comamonas koreensis TaxID=160825 RepID=A0AAW4XU02_9BURK|nr:ATP-dependent DNA ligase [Comamonas koreensis]MCD2164553.1 ATP-dependent DNA ligase [Comamonas koreensis]
MNRFVALYQLLDEASGTRDRELALQQYFAGATAAEATWAVYVLSGGKVNTGKNRLATTTELRSWVSELTALPLWLVEESYRQVGDLAETLSLLVAAWQKKGANHPELAAAPGTAIAPDADAPWHASLLGATFKTPDNDSRLDEWTEQFLLPLVAADAEQRKRAIQQAWQQLDTPSRLVFNKLLTGSLRAGVNKRSLQNSLAPLVGISAADMAHRMVGEWLPSAQAYEALMDPETSAQLLDKPYPFYLASPLPQEPDALGDPMDWLAEWKWDGIRVQLVRRQGHAPYLWSRGEERLDGRFPELETAAALLPRDMVLDGELLAWDYEQNKPLGFVALQSRIQKRKPSAKLMQTVPARILFYDLLECDGEDLRAQPLEQRRIKLERIIHHADLPALDISPQLPFESWDVLPPLRNTAAEHNAEGLMLKALASPYKEGRRRGDWWKWKVDPFSIDAVLIYAQSGSGRRSTLHTDYTFAVWSGDALVPVAKAYSGLTDVEILRLDKWIRSHTVERFGPVRSVTPSLVFEIAFEGVNRSTRHKSGVAVRFPRILRWREDKTAQDADQLSALLELADG